MPTKTISPVIAPALLMLAATQTADVLAQKTHEGGGAGEHGEAHGEVHHGYHKNLIAGFVGGAFEGIRDGGLALGIEYERRLNENWGVGAIAEHTFGDIDAWVYAIPVAFHNGPWKFYAAPGIEDGDHGSETLWRLGVEYGFHHGQWEISPQFDVDFVDGEEIFVIGLTFGWGF